MKRQVNSLFAAAVLGFLFTGIAFSVRAELPVKPVLTLEMAEQIARAAQDEAKRRKSEVVIAVVDDGGYPILLKRLNHTQVASAQVGIDKARTAAIFRRPSREFEEQVRKGRVSAIALAGAVPLQGGLPIIVEGEVIGAIGVSGNTPQEDEDIAQAGLDGLKTMPVRDAVTHLPSDTVSEAFDAGRPLHETTEYKVHASRRVAAGEAEVHEHETDIIHVLQGSAEFVTGGHVVRGRVTSPGEIRGAAIEGGQSRRISKGDVIVVPAGTPHWFKQVEGTVLYYVVKPIS